MKLLNAVRRLLDTKFSDYYLSIPFKQRLAGLDKLSDAIIKSEDKND